MKSSPPSPAMRPSAPPAPDTRAGPPAGMDFPRVVMVLKRIHGRGGMQFQARRVAWRLRDLGVPVTLLGHAHSAAEAVTVPRVPTLHLHASGGLIFAARLFLHLVRRRR